MNKNEQTYLDLLRDVMDNGQDRPDRTGVGVRSVFGRQSRYDLTAGFPMLTTKKMDLKSVLSELLWFIEGSGDERRLAEIRYGKPRSELDGKKTIWTENRDAPYWKDKSKFEGDLGRVYGVQWRKWRTAIQYSSSDELSMLLDQGATFTPTGASSGVAFTETDQITNLIDGIKRDPFGRRHILSAWNPGELSQMALPPCHCLAQFYVSNGKLSCQLYQRSQDKFLGEPFNVMSYTLLTHMLAQVCGLKVGEFIHTAGDSHIYHNSFDAVDEQLKRSPRPAPQLYMDPTIKNIDDFKMEHFEVMGYDPHPVLRVPMAV